MIPLDSVRKALYQKRALLSTAQIQEKSERICASIKDYIKKDAVIGFYMAMADEVQVTSLLKECWGEHICAVPITSKKGQMDFYTVNRDTQFQMGNYGILEPQFAQRLTEPLDVILVPMVGFDRQLHRIGHGVGYYDRYLANTHGLKIGIAFACQECHFIMTKPHDIDMDIIITENEIYKKEEQRLR